MAATPSSSGRREFLRFLAITPLAVFTLGAGKAGAQATTGAPDPQAASGAQATSGAATVCPADDEAMRESLNYLAVSPYGPTKDCTNCKLWSAPAPGTSCGGCTLIEGAIDPHGYCDSWAAIGSASPATQSGQTG